MIEAQLDEILEPDPDEPYVEDLTEVAAAHPVEHKRIDLERLNVRELLSIGDVEDMARELGTDPNRLASVLSRGESVALEVAIVLGWIIGRKADPELTLDHVRRFWQIEIVGVATRKPGPTDARATKIPRSSGQRSRSQRRG